MHHFISDATCTGRRRGGGAGGRFQQNTKKKTYKKSKQQSRSQASVYLLIFGRSAGDSEALWRSSAGESAHKHKVTWRTAERQTHKKKIKIKGTSSPAAVGDNLLS